MICSQLHANIHTDHETYSGARTFEDCLAYVRVKKKKTVEASSELGATSLALRITGYSASAVDVHYLRDEGHTACNH